MQGWIVRSTLTDTYGEIVETLSQGLTAHQSMMIIADKVSDYDGSYWELQGRGPRVARFTHSESGAKLMVHMEYGSLAYASKF